MQEEKVYQVNGWRLTAILLIVLIIVAALSASGMYFVWRSEAHLALRQGQNVLTALRMVGLQYYGSGERMYDLDTRSGLTESAEQQVRRLTDSEGDIMVMDSTPDMLEPTKIIYHEGKYLVLFYLDEEKGARQWEVFRVSSVFDLDGSAIRNYE